MERCGTVPQYIPRFIIKMTMGWGLFTFFQAIQLAFWHSHHPWCSQILTFLFVKSPIFYDSCYISNTHPGWFLDTSTKRSLDWTVQPPSFAFFSHIERVKAPRLQPSFRSTAAWPARAAWAQETWRQGAGWFLWGLQWGACKIAELVCTIINHHYPSSTIIIYH